MARILYLGLKVPEENPQVVHCPIIKIIPRNFNELDIRRAFSIFSEYTHLVLTSQTAVQLFLEAADFHQVSCDTIRVKQIIAVGKKTASKLSQCGLPVHFVPEEETAEGICELFESEARTSLHVFWPHSALSRAVLTDYWTHNTITYTSCILYNTITNREIPLQDLSTFDEIVFTSPSTVDAFLERYQCLPQDKKLTPIGPITAARLRSLVS